MYSFTKAFIYFWYFSFSSLLICGGFRFCFAFIIGFTSVSPGMFFCELGIFCWSCFWGRVFSFLVYGYLGSNTFLIAYICFPVFGSVTKTFCWIIYCLFCGCWVCGWWCCGSLSWTLFCCCCCCKACCFFRASAYLGSTTFFITYAFFPVFGSVTKTFCWIIYWGGTLICPYWFCSVVAFFCGCTLVCWELVWGCFCWCWYRFWLGCFISSLLLDSLSNGPNFCISSLTGFWVRFLFDFWDISVLLLGILVFSFCFSWFPASPSSSVFSPSTFWVNSLLITSILCWILLFISVNSYGFDFLSISVNFNILFSYCNSFNISFLYPSKSICSFSIKLFVLFNCNSAKPFFVSHSS